MNAVDEEDRLPLCIIMKGEYIMYSLRFVHFSFDTEDLDLGLCCRNLDISLGMH